MLLTTVVPRLWNMAHAAMSIGIHDVIAADILLNADVTDEFMSVAVVVIAVALVEKLVTGAFRLLTAVPILVMANENAAANIGSTAEAKAPATDKTVKPTPARARPVPSIIMPGPAAVAATPIAAIAAVSFAVAVTPRLLPWFTALTN